MSNVWTYGRRPSSVVRYRHGGYNAIYPLAHGETFNGVAETQRLERLAAEGGLDVIAVEAPTVTVSGESNVLRFPNRRKRNDSTGRATTRKTVPPKGRD
ncbi:hypothetical protein EOI86_15735 [Hwanghaeella grinnelliae]|uniref:Uncharacterized protein n=1 Tax=Hwanghaeella grinnelliae TaxID=2500179 RepID=A0A437QQ16_9PROT|nr:hypothetical protein [Hwanghaeella grinnelliae]RVU36631.1 hypothetical protein EOI86_15735 [Hwanghaeella grinnelliae]